MEKNLLLVLLFGWHDMTAGPSSEFKGGPIYLFLAFESFFEEKMKKGGAGEDSHWNLQTYIIEKQR